MFQATDMRFEMTPFFEMTPDLVCIASKDGYFQKINQAVYKCLGYDEAELFSRPIASFIYPDDQELTRRERIKLINGTPLINFQNRYVTKKGELVWLQWTSIYFADQELVFAIAKNITERKLMEQAIETKYLEFKELATHFKQTVERDRKLFADEIHEQIAQLASVIKLDMDWLMNNLPESSGFIRNRLEHAAMVTDLMTRTIGKLSFSISPNMLEDTDLHAALNAVCFEFSRLHGIPCSIEPGFDDSACNNEMKLDFFRICQEALRNTTYEATRVCVSLKTEAENICLWIRIEGQSFKGREAFAESALKDIKSRVASIHGHLTILPIETGGTIITVLVAR